jgi:NADH-quinone oxidoreductase subunit J
VAETILFYLFAVGVLVAGAQVVFRKNPIHSALSLCACFFFLAGIYVLLAAHLIAVLQVMVYVGAVMVLFVFVIMLLNLRDENLAHTPFTVWKGVGLAAVLVAVGAVVFRALGGAYQGARLVDLAGRVTDGVEFGSVKAVARTIYVGSVLPFELTSLLLLVAVVGAVVIAKGRI